MPLLDLTLGSLIDSAIQHRIHLNDGVIRHRLFGNMNAMRGEADMGCRLGQHTTDVRDRPVVVLSRRSITVHGDIRFDQLADSKASFRAGRAVFSAT